MSNVEVVSDKTIIFNDRKWIDISEYVPLKRKYRNLDNTVASLFSENTSLDAPMQSSSGWSDLSVGTKKTGTSWPGKALRKICIQISRASGKETWTAFRFPSRR